MFFVHGIIKGAITLKHIVEWVKNMKPKRQTLFKSLTALLIFTFLITYIGSALSNQETLLPDKSLNKLAENRSNVSLASGQKDLVHAEVPISDEGEPEKDDEEVDQESEPEKDGEEGDQKGEQETGDQVEQEGNKETDEQEATEEKQENKSEQKSLAEKDTKKDSDTGDVDADKDGPHDETGIGGDERPDRDINSSTIEITKPNGDTASVVNDYFTTSIKDGETVTEQDYTFSIRQYDHPYQVKDIQVRMKSGGGVVHHVAGDYSQPIDVQTTLTEGENNLRIAIT